MRILVPALLLAIVAGVHSLSPGDAASPAAELQLPTRALGYYDPMLHRVVLVGGPMELRAGARDGVWSWSGRRWEPVSAAPAPTGPPSRGNAAIAHDAQRKATVFAGGAAKTANDSSYEILGESWTTSASGWGRMAGSDIPPRDHLSMTFDEARGTVLTFGGIPGDRATPWPSDTWELRADGWSRVATAGPAGRGRTAMVYDGKRRQVVLFGGVGAPVGADQTQPWFNDTWVFEQGAWRKVADGGPRARYAHGMAFDERAGVVLLYSGAAAHRGAPLSDMWQWDGARWTEIALTGATPGHRYQPVMVYDRARDRTVLYGGDPSKTDTWEWDGKRWTEVRP